MVQYTVPAEGRQPYESVNVLLAATNISCALPDDTPAGSKSFQF